MSSPKKKSSDKKKADLPQLYQRAITKNRDVDEVRVMLMRWRRGKREHVFPRKI